MVNLIRQSFRYLYHAQIHLEEHDETNKGCEHYVKQCGAICSNCHKIATAKQKINVDNKSNFRYPDD